MFVCQMIDEDWFHETFSVCLFAFENTPHNFTSKDLSRNLLKICKSH
jgi:hypothetical protein